MSAAPERIDAAPGVSDAAGAAHSASKERLRVWLRILKVQKLIEARLRERLREDFNSTLPRFDVMAALSRSGAGLKMSELSEVLRVSNGNVTGIVDRLSKDGWAERVPVEGDRRALRVRLTETGRAQFDAQAAAHETWVDALLSEFSETEAQALSHKLNAVAQTIANKRKI